jgi:uncharacterized protein YeaO (DUF488 family)
MPVLIVRLGSSRQLREGLRLGTVRRPPRGVPKAEYASRDFYDVWLPNLAPSRQLMKQGQSAQDDKAWSAFQRKFRSEMNQSGAEKIIDLLAALSHTTDFSLGCYCQDENRCHRSILRQLLAERGARFRER